MPSVHRHTTANIRMQSNVSYEDNYFFVEHKYKVIE